MADPTLYRCAADLYETMGCPWYWRFMKQARRDAYEAAFASMGAHDIARLGRLVAVGRDQFWVKTDNLGPQLRLSAMEARAGFFAHLSLDQFLEAAPVERPRVYLQAVQELQEHMQARRFGWKTGLMMAAAAFAGGSILFTDWLTLQPGYREMAQSFAHLAFVKWGVGTFSYMAAGYAKDRLIDEASRRLLDMRGLSPAQRAGLQLGLLAARVSAVVAFMHSADRLHEAFAGASGSGGGHALAAHDGLEATEPALPGVSGPIPAWLLERAKALDVEGVDITRERLHELEDLGKELTPEMLAWVGEQLERLLRLQQRTEQAGLLLFAAHHGDSGGHGQLALEASRDLLRSVPAPFAKKRDFEWFLSRRVELFREHGLGAAEALLSLHMKDNAAQRYARSDAVRRAEMFQADPPPARYRAAAARADSILDPGWVRRRLLSLRETCRECVRAIRDNGGVACGAALDWLDEAARNIAARSASDPRERRVFAACPADLVPIGAALGGSGMREVAPQRQFQPLRSTRPRG